MGLIRGDDVILRLVLLEHQPHRFNVFLGVSPVAFRIQVAEIKFVLQTGEDVGHRARDLASHKCFPAARRFVVEQNAVARKQTIGFTVIDGDPVRVHFRAPIWTTRVKRRSFRLRNFLHFAEYFAGRRLIKARLDAGLANGLQ